MVNTPSAAMRGGVMVNGPSFFEILMVNTPSAAMRGGVMVNGPSFFEILMSDLNASVARTSRRTCYAVQRQSMSLIDQENGLSQGFDEHFVSL
jgi:hypothetical protein